MNFGSSQYECVACLAMVSIIFVSYKSGGFGVFCPFSCEKKGINSEKCIEYGK